ncbi:heterokaryon incompatibility protein-domain-containing protein [Rostrohypoxylon terebratum]|nr:heterokaryon incompatibility protein-domain-containing protein [Rostrohypoxylon terebratum]
MVKPEPNQLCPQCRDLNLSREKFLPGGKYNGGLPGFLGTEHDAAGLSSHQLGYLDDIYRRRGTCCFCWLIFEATYTQTSSQSHAQIGLDGLTGDGKRVECNLDWCLDGRFLEPGDKLLGDGKSTGHVLSRRILLSNPQHLFPNAYIMLLSPETGHHATANFLARPIPPSHVEINLIRHWLHTCSRTHGDSCRILPRQTKHIDIARSVRYIDLVKQCLVTPSGLPADEVDSIHYATLSYVWGSHFPSLSLRRENYDLFRFVGGLGPDTPGMPTTIQDAMKIVQEIGIRYIWVDALCIIQDDREDWSRIAPLMDAIYGNSTLNICAAFGSDNMTGIPGSPLTPRSASQSTAEVNDIKLTVMQSVESKIISSPWNDRAWTFQERMLSRRSVIFVDDHVIFQCSRATWAEGVNSDTARESWTLEMIESPLQNFSKIPIRQFADFIELYSPRKLTVIQDKLIAFEGVSSVLASSLAAAMIYGMPNSYFDWALLWEKKEAGDRITRTTSIFPSWSWCGWEGGSTWRLSMVEGTLVNIHEWLSSHTWIVWYYGDENGQLNLVWSGKPPMQNHPSPTRWSGYDAGIPNLYGRDPQRLASRFGIDDSKPTVPNAETIPGCLHFWSYTAHFQLSRKSMSAMNFQSKLEKGLHRFGILDSRGDWCGTIVLHEKWLGSVGGIFEFVAISEARNFSMEELDVWNYYVPEEQHVSEWFAYYALLLAPEEDGTVTERAGLAKIYKSAFQNGSFSPGMKWKEITLR